MQQTDILNDTYNLIDTIKNSDEFKELLRLKKEIEIKYKEIIDNYSLAKDNYSEALKYGHYHPDLNDYQIKLSKIKKELYSKDEVIRYIELEHTIQKELDKITNEIKQSMSSHFNLKKIID